MTLDLTPNEASLLLGALVCEIDLHTKALARIAPSGNAYRGRLAVIETLQTIKTQLEGN